LSKVSVLSGKVSGATLTLTLQCAAPPGRSCRASVILSIRETRKHHDVLAISAARHSPGTTHETVVVGKATVTIGAGQAKTVHVTLSGYGKYLLKVGHRLPVKLSIREAGTRTTTLTTTFTSWR
jgi:hypothetical protein